MRRPEFAKLGAIPLQAIAAAAMSFSTALVAQSGNGTPAVVERYGTGIAGTFGEPKVTLRGQILAGHEVTFGMRFGVANAPGCIEFGTRQAPVIIPGFQVPLHVSPITTIGVVLDDNGTLELAPTLPLSSTLVGTPFALQAFLADPLAPNWISASRGVEFVIGASDSAAPRVLPIAKATLDQPRHAQQVDLDGDGVLDLLTGGPTLGYVLGNGDGTFAPLVTIPGYAFIQALAVGDFNGDGHQDFACLDNFTDLVVSFGQGNLTFAPPISLGIGSNNHKLLAADVNGDGSQDLLIGTDKISVRLANGAGGFGPATDYALGQSPSAVTAMRRVDWDGDNYDDVIVGTTNPISVFAGSANGTLQSRARVFARGDIVDIGDFNNDGVMDIAAVSVNRLIVYHLLPNGAYAGTFEMVIDDQARIIKDFVTGRFASDGPPDVAVLTERIPDAALLIVYNDRANGWTVTNELTSMVAFGFKLFTADYDGDRAPDFAAVGTLSSDVALARGKGNGSVHRRTTTDLPPSPAVLAIGDLNRDGWPDAVTAKAIATGSANGFVAGPGLPLQPLPPEVQLQSLSLHDLDGDGDLDAIGHGPLAGQSTGRVLVWLNHGDGSYAQPAEVFSSSFLAEITVGDINGDAIPDLAVPTGNGATFLRGAGDGSFAPLSTANTTGARRIALGDINQDGHADAAFLRIVSTVQSELQLLLGDGSGTFSEFTLPFFARFDGMPSSIKLADYNGDGRRDVIVATEVGMPREPGVWVLLGVAGSGLLAPAERVILQTTQAIAIGDFNDDGYDDIAAVHSRDCEISIVYGTASATTATRVEQFAASPDPLATHFADVDCDGDLDVVVVDGETGDLVVLHNTSVRE